MKKKILAGVLACVLLIGVGIGGTLAWLNATTEKVTNTFTYGDINIKLDESELQTDGSLKTENRVQANTFKLIPGETTDKDPLVTVEAGSEKCWLFVKVEKSADYDAFMAPPAMADGWVELDATKYPGVYYYNTVIDASQAVQTKYVLKGGTDDHGAVTVLGTVTKKAVDDLEKGIADKTASAPTLTFTAAAIQSEYLKDGDTAVTTAAGAAKFLPEGFLPATT